MSIRMACPACGAAYTLSDELKGKKVRCKKCEEIFAVNGVAKAEVEEAIEPAEKVRVGPRAAGMPVRRRGEDGNGPARTGTRTAAKPVRRRGEDPDDDEAPEPSKASKPGSSKKPLIIAGAVLGVLLLVGGIVGAIAIFGGDEKPKSTPNAGGTKTVAQTDLTAKKDITKTEPDTATEDTKDDDPPLPVGGGQGVRLSQEVLKKVRKSTVYIEAGGLFSGGAGSGFFGVEPGIILTNAHVLGMLRPGSAPPSRIMVVLNSGEEDEYKAPGEILGVDPSSDLAILKIKGPQQRIPPRLKVAPTSKVRESQDIYVVGFPHGLEVNKVASIRKSSVSAFVRDEDTKELRRIQLEGGADPGNSGGPVINLRGEVVGVLVEGYRGSRICRAIPGDHVFNVLNGRVDAVTFHEPYRVAAGEIKVPVEVHLVDPLNRIKEIEIDSWKGPPGDTRPPTTNQPEAITGDSPHKAVKLTVDKDKQVAVGELTLPDKDDSEVYWQQPSCVSAKGIKQWSAGTVCRSLVLPAAERRSANLVLTHSVISRPVELISKATFRVADQEGGLHSLTFDIKTNLIESTRFVDNQGTADVALQYEKLEMKVLVDGQPAARYKSDDKSLRDVRYLRGLLQVDRNGVVLSSKTDLSNVPDESRAFYQQIGDLVQFSMSNLAVPLPNQQVQPLSPWKGFSVVAMGMGAQGQLQGVPMEMQYHLVGARRRLGREEAVIAVKGEDAPQQQNQRGIGQQLKVASKGKGIARGTAVVDVATGQVTLARTFIDIDNEITIQLGDGITATGRAGGRLEVSIRRGDR